MYFLKPLQLPKMSKKINQTYSLAHQHDLILLSLIARNGTFQEQGSNLFWLNLQLSPMR